MRKTCSTSLLYNRNHNIHPELLHFCSQEGPTMWFKHKLLFRTMILEKGKLPDTFKNLWTSCISAREKYFEEVNWWQRIMSIVWTPFRWKIKTSFVLYHLNLFGSCTVVSLNRKLKAVYAQSCHCFLFGWFFVCLFCLLYGISWNRGFPGVSNGKESMWETWVWSLSQEDPLEKEMAIHSLILAWEIPWTEEPGRLQSMRSQRVRHDWVINIHIPWKVKKKKKVISNWIYNSLIRQKEPESIIMSFILIF